MILVVGSTGLLGSEICLNLARRGLPMRALVRRQSNTQKVNRLKQYGAQIAQGDLRDEESIRAACCGVQAVICTATSLSSYVAGENDFQSVDHLGTARLVDAACRSGIPQVIFISCLAAADERIPLLAARRQVEEKIRQSGLVYTILRPSLFMETWFTPESGFNACSGRMVVYGECNRPVHWVSVQDVARMAVNALSDPRLHNAVVEVRGPQGLSPQQVQGIFEAAGQRQFTPVHVSERRLLKQIAAARDPLQQSRLGLCLSLARGDLPARESMAEPAAEIKYTLEDFAAFLKKKKPLR